MADSGGRRSPAHFLPSTGVNTALHQPNRSVDKGRQVQQHFGRQQSVTHIMTWGDDDGEQTDMSSTSTATHANVKPEAVRGLTKR